MSLNKNFQKTLAFLALSTLLIYVLWDAGLLNLGALFQAATDGIVWLFAAALAQLCMLTVSILRYYMLLKASGVKTRLSLVSASTLVSISVGQLLPASQAVSEILRSSILLDWTEPKSKRWAKVAVTSVIEKYLSYLVMLMCSGMALGGIAICQPALVVDSQLIYGVTALVLGIAFVASLGYGLLYFVGSWPWLNQKIESLRKLRSGYPSRSFFIGLLYPEKITAFVYPRKTVFLQAYLSILILIFSSAAYYFCALAAGIHLPFFVIFAVVPLLSLTMFVPLGFAGLGGQQVVAIGFFSLFMLDPQDVVVASLVVNLLIIVLQLILGALCIVFYWPQFQALYRSKAQ